MNRTPLPQPPHGPRILLTGVFGPYGVDDAYGRYENVMELFHNQVTKAQGLASPRFHHRSFGLYFIAANIDAEVTVLDFPSRERFISELRRRYDIVGISFITPNSDKARDMAALVRRVAPAATIVLGGHGTAIDGVERLIDCDHVVRGEGIRWLRRFLGQDPDAPLQHPVLPVNDYHRVYGITIPGPAAGLLVPGLGCTHGCRFCSTSHFFDREYVPILPTGDALYAQACRTADALGCNTFFVMDENFLRDGDRARRLQALMDRDRRWFNFQIFSSADAIRAYGLDALVRLGVTLVWVGLETRRPDAYAKNADLDARAFVQDLRQRGVSVLASGILCSEDHTPANIDAEIDFLVGLEPDFVQFMLLTALPQTALYEETRQRGLLRTDVPFAEWHGQKLLNWRHPAFSDVEPEHILQRAFRRDYECNSSSLYRLTETARRGVRWLEEQPGRDPCLNARLDQARERLREQAMLLKVMRRWAANDRERERVDQLAAAARTELGSPSLRERCLANLALVAAAAWALRVRLCGDRIQPRTRRTVYPRRLGPVNTTAAADV